MRIISIGKRVLKVLDPDQRRAVLGLVPLMVVRAIFDTVGIATVLPFIAVVTDPQGALENRYLRWLYDALGFQSMTPFLVALGCGALFVLLLSNGLTVAVEYLVKRLAQRQRLHHMRMQARTVRKRTDPLAYAFLIDMNQKIEAPLGRHPIPKLDHLAELPGGVDMENGERRLGRIEGLHRQMQQDGRIFPDGIKHHGPGKICRDFPHDMDRFSLQTLEVRMYCAHVKGLPRPDEFAWK